VSGVWRFWYSGIVIPLVWTALRCLGLVNRKVKRGIRGRDGLFDALAASTSRLTPGKRVWFHSSSLGEFEQAKPIIARLKERHPDLHVIVSFFSPSGYEHSKKYPLADIITYLPFDTRGNARTFLDLVNPDAAVMVRYDIWPNHIWELHARGIPTLIANATMRSRSPRFFPLARGFHHQVYNAIDDILTVAPSDASNFRKFRLDHPHIASIGDTRYDQVSTRSADARKRRILPEEILNGRKVIVLGSSWPEDEEVVLPAVTRLLREIPASLCIVVPHEPTEAHLEELEGDLDAGISHIRFSAMNEYNGERIIIVDSVGVLLILYAHARFAFVGGSFKQGVHNVLEAAVYGIPVLFGPRYRNSHEPLMLVERGGGFVVTTSDEAYRTMKHLLEDDTACSAAGERAVRFVQSHVGATEQVLSHLEHRLNGSAGT
jgi:3-deoxy-D-manno-octulosonic-acid transferase